jgi:hypothetical protein
MSQLNPMKGFNLGNPDRRKQAIQFRKIFNEPSVAQGNILNSRQFFTKKSVCPMCKNPRWYAYGDTKQERMDKLDAHLKEKHS